MSLNISSSGRITRRAVLGAVAATTVTAAPVFSNTFGFLRGAGDVRKIKMYSGRTGESIDTVYWLDGKYIKEALKEINYFMRDWRRDTVAKIDRRTIDIMAASHNILDTSEPYLLLSGYRSPQTNAMLRRRSRGVAKKSLHMKGQAADLRLKSRSISQMASAAASCAAGGVGRGGSGHRGLQVGCWRPNSRRGRHGDRQSAIPMRTTQQLHTNIHADIAIRRRIGTRDGR